MDKLPVGQLPDLASSNNDDEIMVITNSEYSQLKKEKISDLITDFTSTNENNALTKGTDGKLFVTDFGNASNITEGTLPVSVLPDIPKDKLPEIETDDLPDSGITAGTYTYPTDIVVNSKGQVTSITEGQAGANNANQDLSNLGPLGLDKLNQSKALETGAVSSDADVYADVQKYAHSTFDLSKFEVVGSPNITNDGILNLPDTVLNYVQKAGLDFSDAESIDLEFEFTWDGMIPEDSLWCLRFTNSNTSTVVNGFISNTSTFNFYIVNNSSPIYGYGAFPLQENVSNLFKLHVTTDNFEVKWYEDGVLKETFSKAHSLDISVLSNILIGYISGSYSSNGTFDLKYLKIDKNGTPIFSGNKTGLDVIKPDNYEVVGSPVISEDGIASGFSDSNYIETPVINLSKPWKAVCQYIKSGSASPLLCFGPSRRNYCYFTETATELKINELSIFVSSSIVLQENVPYLVELSWDGAIYKLNVYTMEGYLYLSVSSSSSTACANSYFTMGRSDWEGKYVHGSIDLNLFKIYVDGNLVYQPCLKIPYTLSKTGSKIVDAAYRDRVQDVYEQYGTAMYYTLDEENQDFTLPASDIYGMITKNREILDIVYPIGRPMPEENNVLLDNEVWLEGATVNIVDYPKLFKVYGTKYGGDGTTTFKLPDLRNRVLWGSSDGSNGYIEAGLPNIKGTVGVFLRFQSNTSGAFTLKKPTVDLQNTAAQNFNGSNTAYFNASNSNPTYSDDVTTVQPPAFKVRWKTRFE